MLFAHCILNNVRCIVIVCQLLALLSRPELVSSIATYIGGYKKALLSDVERALSEGRMRGLMSTNAMELGSTLSTCTAL